MNRKEYDRTRESDLVGRKVRSLRDIERGDKTIFPAGTVFTIGRKFGGFELRGPKCECCGASRYVTKVSPEAVELLPEGA